MIYILVKKEQDSTSWVWCIFNVLFVVVMYQQMNAITTLKVKYLCFPRYTFRPAAFSMSRGCLIHGRFINTKCEIILFWCSPSRRRWFSSFRHVMCVTSHLTISNGTASEMMTTFCCASVWATIRCQIRVMVCWSTAIQCCPFQTVTSSIRWLTGRSIITVTIRWFC